MKKYQAEVFIEGELYCAIIVDAVNRASAHKVASHKIENNIQPKIICNYVLRLSER